jgi:signal transduction histidine kinase
VKKAKILIVEDEGILAKGLENKLITFGYAVTGIAATGEDALRRADENTPDLVLMDIKLKGEMDGIQAAHEIKDRFDIPVVYLTAFGDIDTLKRARATIPYAYIIKPVSERELHCNVEIALYKHKMEREMQKKKKLEAFGTFAMGISHDFNNLLQMSSSHIEMAMQKCDVKKKNCKKSLDESLEYMTKISELPRKYLQTFRMAFLKRKKEKLSPIIKKAFSPLSIPGNIKISCDLYFLKNQLSIYGDEEWLCEMFSNLITNGMEAMADKKHGTLEITAEDISLTPDNDFSLKAGQFIKVKIRDEGKGIPKEDLGKVFDPYFSTKEDYTKKGLGLGLSTCYSVVKSHEGYIEIASEVDKGTTVTVYLPAYTTPIAANR